MSLHAVAVPGAKTRPPPALCRALFNTGGSAPSYTPAAPGLVCPPSSDTPSAGALQSAIRIPFHTPPRKWPGKGTSSDVRTKKRHPSAVSMYVHQHLRTGAAQVQGVNGASSKTGAQPAPRIGPLRCSGGAGFGPKMEPAPSTAKPAPSACQWALFATPQPMYVQKNGIPARFRCTYISSRGAYATDNQIISTTDGYEKHTRQLC